MSSTPTPGFSGGSSRQEKGQTRRKEDGSEAGREGGRGSEHESRLFIGAAFVREEGALPKRDGKNNPGARCHRLGKSRGGGAQGEAERVGKEEKEEIRKTGIWLGFSISSHLGEGSSGLCDPGVPRDWGMDVKDFPSGWEFGMQPRPWIGVWGEQIPEIHRISLWLGIWDAATPLDRGLGRGDPQNPKEGPGKGSEPGHS